MLESPQLRVEERWFTVDTNLVCFQLHCPTAGPGLNFINVLRTAFTLVDPKSIKKIDDLTVFYTLLGSTGVKAVHRTLMKSTPGYVELLLFPISTQMTGTNQQKTWSITLHHITSLKRRFNVTSV